MKMKGPQTLAGKRELFVSQQRKEAYEQLFEQRRMRILNREPRKAPESEDQAKPVPLFTLEDIKNGDVWIKIIEQKYNELKKAIEINDFASMGVLLGYFRMTLLMAHTEHIIFLKLRDIGIPGDIINIVSKLNAIKEPKLRNVFEEASWFLANYCMTDEITALGLIDYGFINVSLGLIDQIDNISVLENMVMALANFCGISHKLRDLLLKEGALERIVMLVTSSNSEIRDMVYTEIIARRVVWLISNLIRDQAVYNNDTFIKLLPYLADIFVLKESHEVIEDCLWAFTYATDSYPAIGELFLREPRILLTIYQKLSHKSSYVRVLALKTFGSLCNSTDECLTDIFVTKEFDFLDGLKSCFTTDPDVNVKIFASCCVSNLLCNSEKDSLKVINHKVFHDVCALLIRPGLPQKLAKELAYIIGNIGIKLSPSMIMPLLRLDFVSVILKYVENNLPLQNAAYVSVTALSRLIFVGEELKLEYSLNPTPNEINNNIEEFNRVMILVTDKYYSTASIYTKCEDISHFLKNS